MSADHPLRIGIKLPARNFAFDIHREVWEIADGSGFDQCWSNDHLLAVQPEPSEPVYEGWALLASMASFTRRIRVGLMVTGNLYRHPSVLAKLAVTVDHISHGRLEMGIGSGWNEIEFQMLGLPYPSAGERIRRLDEACHVLKLLWTQERSTFAGRYYQLTDAIAMPKPVQRPHPPIWIGGSGPRRTLRVVARHADVWNANAPSIETAPLLSQALDQHCVAIGRDPASIRRSVQFPVRGAKDAHATAVQYARAGFTDLIVMLAGPDPRSLAEELARDLVPRIRQLA